MKIILLNAIYHTAKRNIHHILIAFYFIFSMSLYAVYGNHNFYSMMPDEITYAKIVSLWDANGIRYVYETLNENKTYFFLYLQKLYHANAFSTRLLNLLLICINTFLLYSLSKNRLAFLYPLIPLFLNSMWLTVETIEAMFLLLGLRYFNNHMGVAVGLACLFRPYAVVYSILMNKRNLGYILIIGVLASMVLYANDILFVYMDRLFNYGSGSDGNKYMEPDYVALIMMMPLGLAGYSNWKYSKYAFAGMAGFIVQLFGHYFIVPYTFFYLAYLSKSKQKLY